MPPVLAYWDIRGRAHSIRLLLNYVGEEFEDRRYETGPAPDFKKETWFNEKHNLGLDFPNLPYYIDGDVRITQSNAILRYIARKHNLCGSTDDERIRVDLLVEESTDFRDRLVRLCYNPKAVALRSAYLADLPAGLRKFEMFIGKREFFAGSSVTFVDFLMYDILDQHRIIFPNSLEGFDQLNKFLKTFEDIPEIKKYMGSDGYQKRPCNNKMAPIGNS